MPCQAPSKGPSLLVQLPIAFNKGVRIISFFRGKGRISHNVGSHVLQRLPCFRHCQRLRMAVRVLRVSITTWLAVRSQHDSPLFIFASAGRPVPKSIRSPRSFPVPNPRTVLSHISRSSKLRPSSDQTPKFAHNRYAGSTRPSRKGAEAALCRSQAHEDETGPVTLSRPPGTTLRARERPS